MKYRVVLKKYIWLVLFAVLISSCFFTHNNKIADLLLPKTEIKLTITDPGKLSKGHEVWIYLIDGKEIEKNTFESMEKTGEWSFMSQEDGAANNTIIGSTVGGTIVIPINKSCSGGINIWMQSYSASINMEVDNVISNYDLYSEEGEYLQITPYEDSLISIGIRAVLYGLFSALIMAVLLICYKLMYSANFTLQDRKYYYRSIVLAVCRFDVI